MKRWITVVIFGILFSFTLLFMQIKTAEASASTVLSTSMTLMDPGDIFASTPFKLSGVLRDSFGHGVAGKNVAFYLAGNPIGHATTDNLGYFETTINKTFVPGSYLVTAYFRGSYDLAASRTELYLYVYPGTDLVLTQINGVELGKSFTITGVLKDQSTGLGIPNKNITFLIDGDRLGTTQTDEVGDFSLQVKKNLDANSYLISASFNGSHHIAPANDYLILKILPSQVKVQTVPAVPGITFKMNGRTFVTGTDGIASIDIYKAGQYRLDALVNLYHSPNQQVQFGRWEAETYQPSRMVQVPTTGVIKAGLNIFHQVGVSFVDLDGYAIDPSRITSVTVRSLQGDVFDLKVNQLQWLPASRIARRQSGLEETDLLYSVINVTIDGSNVVNSAQQKFYLRQNTTWNISVLLYSFHFTATDGLFGFPVGKSIDLQLPNGKIQNYPLDKSGNVVVHTLARGDYHVTLVGVRGIGTTVPVALSRQQYVTMKVVTPLDMAVAALAGLTAFFGLIFYGRPWLLTYPFRRRKAMDFKA